MTKQRLLLTTLLILCLLLGTTSCTELEELSSTVDSDGDGWSNTQEKIAGTDPNNVDSDSDGYWDPHDPNPLDPSIPVNKGLPKPTSEPTASPTPTPLTPEPTPTTTPGAPATSTAAPPVSAEAAAAEELRKVQIAVTVMMRNNNLTQLAHPVRVPTNDMHRFPDASTRHGIAGAGYVLYLHDFDGDGRPDTNYISFSNTKGTYICEEYGNVTQVSAGHE